MQSLRGLLLVREGDAECREAEEFLRRTGVPFDVFDVDNGLGRSSLWKDLATNDLPVLAIRDVLVYGLSSIKDYMTKRT